MARRPTHSGSGAVPWMTPLVGIAVGCLVGSLMVGAVGHGRGGGGVRAMDLVLFGLVLVLVIVRRGQAARAQPRRAAQPLPQEVKRPPVGTTTATDPRVGADLERGVGDIRRSDPGFDSVRLSGYTAMTFRDVQAAWMTGDVASLRPRVTPEIQTELEVQSDRLRGSRRSNRVEEIDVRAEITEAWQESGRDYVTAYISGSMVDYTVDDVSDALVDGSRTKPRRVEEFWTFTRPAGLNFWMLSAIQTS